MTEPSDRIAAYKLLETAALVAFDLLDTHVEVASNGYGAALQPDGHLVVVGTRATSAGDAEFLVARYRD